MKKKLFITVISMLLWINNLNAQTTIFEDALDGATEYGTMVGGYFNSEGYRPNKGLGHILYILPQQVSNGYLEFQFKGFTPDLIEDAEQDADNGFFGMYDGRGISEPIQYFDDFKTNFFRWNFHYRQNRSAFKSVIQCAAPTPERLNATKATFGYTSEGLIAKDWGEEPMGINYTTNATNWYTVKAEWKDKQFKIYINGTLIWSASGPYDYAPIDHRIWIGSAPGVGDKYSNSVPTLTYRNVKVVSYDVVVDPDSLSITPDEIEVDYSAGTTNFEVKSNSDWTINNDSGWLVISPLSGNGDTTVTVSYDDNDLFESRTSFIEITTGSITDTVTVIQAARPMEYINLSQNTATVPFNSGQLELDIEANIDWYYVNNYDWITLNRKNNTQNDTLVINYTQNNNSNQRMAELVLTNDTITSVFNLIQSGSNVYINISKRSWDVSKNSGNVTFYIESNQDWTLIPKVNWLSTSFQDSSGNASFMVNYSTNTDTSSRVGYVVIQTEFIADSVSVVQAGAAPFEVSTSVFPEEAGYVNGSGIFGEGSNVTLKAVSNPGWKFDNWTEDGNIISEDTVWTFKLKSDRNFIANFSIITDVGDYSDVPFEYNLSQNYPNPFNPTTNIKFSIPEAAEVSISVYNMLGELVSELVNSLYSPGHHSINFNAQNFPSGVYVYSIKANGVNGKRFLQTRKMLLLK